ncbi:MAG TPA: TolC family protein [Planctomycetota bacterium]|nr:TolC family protein [Planctomycetota bacterium]
MTVAVLLLRAYRRAIAPAIACVVALSAAPAQDHPSSLALTARDAALQALANNRALRVRRFDIAAAQADAAIARAAFDPVLSGEASRSIDDVGPRGEVETDRASLGVAVTAPTGTTLGVDSSIRRDDAAALGEAASARVGVTVSQALLRGARPSANLAELRAARLDVSISRWELAGFALELAARAEDAYWDLVLARQSLVIVRESLTLAERQRDEIVERIAVGRLAGVEQAAADAELAIRRQALIDAEAGEAVARIRLLALIEPTAAGLSRAVTGAESPDGTAELADPVDQHLALARERRPDLRQARLLIEREELVIVRTRDGLLPRLDLFASFGSSGYARSVGRAYDAIDGDVHDATVGLRVEYAFGRRAERAAVTRAVATRAQAEEALANLVILDEADVRIAHIDAERARAQAVASAASVTAQEAALEVEVEKLRVGSGTALDVARAQRDLTQRRLEGAEAAIARRKALTALYRDDGSLLDRRGIQVAER